MKILLSLLLTLPVATSAVAQPAPVANGIGRDQCGQYVEAYQKGPDGYGPYILFLQGFTSAISVTMTQRTGRAVDYMQGNAPAAAALWLNNWCLQNPLRPFVDAATQFVDATAAAAPPAPQYSPPPQYGAPVYQAPPVVVMPAPAANSSCRVGDTKNCPGCAITCPPGQVANCKEGTDWADGKGCAFKSACSCRSM